MNGRILVTTTDRGMEATMKAFALPDDHSAATFQDIAVPDPGPGEIRVAVKASSVNGFDVFVASGMARGMMEHRYPVVVGKDFAGIVDAVGDGVERFSVGDEVAGIAPPEEHVGRGAYAEFIVVPATGFIEPKPSNLSFEQAASVGLAALTGLVAVDAVGASDGDVVLVTGATGGVGSYAVQIGAARGATVIATSLPDDESWIRSLGASEIVDYRGDVAKAVRASHPDGIDALIDAVNMGDAHNSVAGLVKGGGHVVSTTGSADEDGLSARGVGASNVFAQGHPARFASVVRMAADGDLQVPIRQTFSFDELPQALGLVGERSSRGKFAVTIA
jgi:NADPH:quinone reductase-like Zn-dependent oxidoreductase